MLVIAIVTVGSVATGVISLIGYIMTPLLTWQVIITSGVLSGIVAVWNIPVQERYTSLVLGYSTVKFALSTGRDNK